MMFPPCNSGLQALVRIEESSDTEGSRRMDEIEQESIEEETDNTAEKMDRLSDLPDDLIVHILSSPYTRTAVQTCVLSKQWRHQWTRINRLNFDYRSFNTMVSFGRFVINVLSQREPYPLQSLRFHPISHTNSSLMKRVVAYAMSYNVEELNLSNLHDWPQQLGSCQSLVTLKLRNPTGQFPAVCSFPSLTALYISDATLSDENGSTSFIISCKNLKRLVFTRCFVDDVDVLTIFNPHMVEFHRSKSGSFWLDVYWSEFCDRMAMSSSENLVFFDYKGLTAFEFMLVNCLNLEKVNICVSVPEWISLNHIKRDLTEWLCPTERAKSFTVTLMSQWLGDSTSITFQLENNKGTLIGKGSPHLGDNWTEIRDDLFLAWKQIGFCWVENSLIDASFVLQIG